MVKKKTTRHSVRINLGGEPAKRVEELLASGLYGTTIKGVVETVLAESLARVNPSDYRIVLKLEGYPAYALSSYAKATMTTDERALGYIVNDWVSRNSALLSSAGIGLRSPEWQRFIQEKKGKR